MGGYQPLSITGMQKGLVQNRENFILPNDAYPTLQNAYVWRERILRKKGYQLLGRLQRAITGTPTIGTTDGSGNFTGNIFTDAPHGLVSQGLIKTIEFPTIVLGSIKISVAGDGTFTETTPFSGILSNGTGGTGTINYQTGAYTLTNTGQAGASITLPGFSYYPNLPVMGLRILELQNSANDQTIAFDQVYAYTFNSGTMQFQEFITGTTWNAAALPVTGVDFFYSTNYWVSGTANSPFGTNNKKLFWVTNNSGHSGLNADPPRITDQTTWVNFYPSTWSQLDNGTPPQFLQNWLAMLPFRGRMLTFNTWEGGNGLVPLNFPQRIRWSTIGNPFIAYLPGPPATGSWRDDIRGQGGYLDIPTSEDIVSVGFVRDNVVIYCERSTWQLRYTGRSIAPFQIERVNSELGAESLFSAVQFDTSLVGIGDKGIVECDSYKSTRIDIKIPDFVFDFNALNDGVFRVQGIRDFPKKLAYWTIPYVPAYAGNISNGAWIFPNTRLVFNYENDSWALFNDSLTALGQYQTQSSRTWLSTPDPWIDCDFTWLEQPISFPAIVGGNQQGFVEYLNVNVTNDVSLYISAITANTTTATVVTSPNHNMVNGFVISISGIPLGTAFANLNNPQQGLITAATQANPCQITSTGHGLSTGTVIIITGILGMTQLNTFTYTITVVDANNFTLNGINSTAFTAYSSGGTWTNQAINVFSIILGDASGMNPQNVFQLMIYNPISQQFNTPQLDVPSTSYIGNGKISILENFSIVSKKFNFIDEGQNIQMGYLDILMDSTGDQNAGNGQISLNVYVNYDDVNATNILPENTQAGSNPPAPDSFFNVTIPTTQTAISSVMGTKFWQRVFCPTVGNFLTLQYTFTNAQMASIAVQNNVQIDACVLWVRKGGRMTVF